MRILILASIPFDGLRRRQQQVALGLSARGHDVLYVEPPRPFRSLVDPARFEPQEIASPAQPEERATAQAQGRPSTRADRREVAPQLTVLRKGVGMAKMGEWGWAARVGWRMWAAQVRQMVSGEQASIALIYHPALIAAARESLRCPLVFECLDDFPSLAPSSGIAAAYDEALQGGLPQVDGFLAVNRYLAESWSRFLRAGVPQQVIEHGVDLDLFRPVTGERRRRARQTLEIAEGVPTAVYLGRFDARVSFADLERMLTLEPELQLLLLGEVSSEGRVILQRLPDGRVRHVGPLRPEQACELIAAADIALLPLRREPHLEPIRGLKLYEYLATGLPVLAAFRRGVKAFRDVIYLYTDAEELADGLRAALTETEDAAARSARIRIAQASGWQQRVAEIERFLTGIVATEAPDA